jgi:hypothetical protein
VNPFVAGDKAAIMMKKPSSKKEVRKSRTAPRQPTGKPDPWGCMAGTITIQPGVDLTAPNDEPWNSEEKDHRNK